MIAAGTRVRQAEATVAQAHLVPNPTLSASAGDYAVGETNPPGLTFSDTAIYTTALGETVEIGKRGPRIAAAESRLEAERQAYADTVARVTGEARAALARVVYLRARLAFLEESLQAGRQIETLQRSRLDNGDISGSDFDRLLVDTSLLESDVARTRADTGEAMPRAVLSYARPATPPPRPRRHRLHDRGPGRGQRRVGAGGAARSAQPRSAGGGGAPTPSWAGAAASPTRPSAYTHDNLVSGDQPKTLALGVDSPCR